MMWLIMLSVLLGVGFGYFIMPAELYSYTDGILSVGLCVLLLFVGMDMGKQKDILKQIKKIGWNVLIVPAMIAFGSIFGSIVVGMFLGMPLNEAGAVGAGFGWYSLSAVLIADYSPTLSAVAFLSNVVREILAILVIPFIAKYIGHYEAVAPAGATSMDTTLPIITRYTDPKTAVAGFVSGVILSAAVPIVVPIILAL